MTDAPRILCCGEALIDMLPRRTAEGDTAFQPFAGGAVFNTAIALGRLERSAGLLTGLSTDLFGRVLADELAASGADVSLAVRSHRPTTLAFVELKDGQASYAFYDENTAGRMLAKADLPMLPDDTAVLFFGGISLVAEPCGSSYEALALREAGARVIMLDPNIRPGFIRDEAAYRARISRMIAAADIVKLSDEDLHWLAGAGDMPALARAIIAEGPHLVCITQGAAGAHAFTRGQHVQLPAPKVTVADTVGAGDTFNAGLLASLDVAGLLTREGLADLPRNAIRDALTLAMKAAAVTVSRAGANPPRLSELG